MVLKSRLLMMVSKAVFYHIVSFPDIGPTYIHMQGYDFVYNDIDDEC